MALPASFLSGTPSRTGAAPGGGALPGLTSRYWTDAYGGVPQVSDPTQTAGAAVAGNLGNMASIYNLGTGYNQFTNAAARSAVAEGLPGYGDMVAKSSDNIMANLSGQVAPDVIAQLAQQGAERGIRGGMGVGAPNANAAYLRALGLTSIDLQKLGETELTAAIARTPVGKAFDPMSMMVSPDAMQTAQTAANLFSSAPNPAAAARAAEAAAMRGIGAGAGAVGGRAAASVPGWMGAGGEVSAPTGTMIGGVEYGPGQNPMTAYQNWLGWVGGGFGGGGTSSGSTPPAGTISLPDQSVFDPNYSPSEGSGPFALYGQMLQGMPPSGTISTANQSTYDPFADITGGESYDFSLPMAAGGE